MSVYEWKLSAGAPLCGLSDSFYRTVREAVFQQLTTETTPEQFQSAQEHIKRLRDELLRDIQPMHYGALIGTHRCVNQLFREARARLCALQIMQPAPEVPAPPPPAPPPKPRTLSDVLKGLAGTTEEETGE